MVNVLLDMGVMVHGIPWVSSYMHRLSLMVIIILFTYVVFQHYQNSQASSCRVKIYIIAISYMIVV